VGLKILDLAAYSQVFPDLTRTQASQQDDKRKSHWLTPYQSLAIDYVCNILKCN